MVREGYKQTEVGVIPEDWEVGCLQELCVKIQDGTHFSPKLGGNDFLYVTSKNIGVGKLDITSAEKISAGEHSKIYKRCDVRSGDVLLTKDGANTGNAAFNHLSEEFSLLSSVAFLRFDNGRHVPIFFLQQILSSEGQKRLKDLMVGNAITRLTLGKINGLKFSYPIKAEQQAIAEALSDVDGLIDGLEKVIAKKRDIKTATMQQLLTGKTRLPGFGEGKGYKQAELGEIPEDWGLRQFGQLVSQLEAGVSVNSVDEENILYGHEESILKTSSVYKGKFYPTECKKIVPKDIKRAKVHPDEDSIIFSRMNTPALVGECGYVDKDYELLFLPDRLWITRFTRTQETVPRWLAYLLSYGPINKSVKDTATGTSGSMKNISKDALFKILLPTPCADEQQAIATILSDMDNELESLQARLNKTKAIKQGMMQELLTGKTRLI